MTPAPPLSPAAHLRLPLVLRELQAARAASVVEVGPGQGGISWHLARGRRYTGYEPDDDSYLVATRRLSEHERAEVHNEPLPNHPRGEYDALVALEVLEHIEADEEALRSWTRWVPGGVIVVSVPAKQKRFGRYDEMVGHVRRYEQAELEALLSAVGLRDIHIRSYGMPLGYLLEAVRNRVLTTKLEDCDDAGPRTMRSGRSFQPRGHAKTIALGVGPFVMLQRPFERTGLGIGWVACGRVP